MYTFLKHRAQSVEHITIFRLSSLIREVKDKHQIENGKSLKDTDLRVKLAAIEALEEIAAPFPLLRTCIGSWWRQAHVSLLFFFF